MTARREDPRLRADRLQLEHDNGTHPGRVDPRCEACLREVEQAGHLFVQDAAGGAARCSCRGWRDNPGHGSDVTEAKRAWFAHAAHRTGL